MKKTDQNTHIHSHTIQQTYKTEDRQTPRTHTEMHTVENTHTKRTNMWKKGVLLLLLSPAPKQTEDVFILRVVLVCVSVAGTRMLQYDVKYKNLPRCCCRCRHAVNRMSVYELLTGSRRTRRRYNSTLTRMLAVWLGLFPESHIISCPNDLRSSCGDSGPSPSSL